MGHWVVQKKSNFALVAGILGIVLGGVGLMAVVAIYLSNKTH
jgi:hypothetical protein